MTALTIFGATGYTGRLCAEEAVRHGIPVRLAGRRRAALERLAEHLGAADVAVADAADPASLERLARTSGVLLSTVGPYEQHGRPVVEAALAAGCHYLDVTGEVFFLDWVHQQGFRARQAGSTLAPAVGFDGAFGDLLAAIAASALDEPVIGARVAYLVRGGRWSQGTARSALGMGDRGGARGSGEGIMPEPVLADGWRAPFPDPLGAQQARSAPLPEVVLLGRSVGALTTRTYLCNPLAGLLGPAGALVGRAVQLASSSPLLGVLERAVDVLPEGPDDEGRHNTRCAVLVELRGESGGTQRAWVRLRDPYGMTARLAIGVARRFAGSGPPRPGVLTIAQALDGACADFLAELGVDWALLDPAA